MPDAFAWLEIPNVNNRVPATRDQSGVVDELDCKYSVVVADMIPISFLESARNRFGFLIIDSDVEILPPGGELATTPIEV